MEMTTQELTEWHRGHIYMAAEEKKAQEEAQNKMLISMGLARPKNGN